MIHQVKLPMLTKQRLSEVVDVQMALLSYAVTEKDLDEGRCAAYLQAKGFDNTKQERSLKIAQWIWRKSRREKLEKFATGPAEEKQKLVERLQPDKISLKPFSLKTNHSTFVQYVTKWAATLVLVTAMAAVVIFTLTLNTTFHKAYIHILPVTHIILSLSAISAIQPFMAIKTR